VNFFNYKNSRKILMVTAVTIAVLFVVVLPALLLGGEAMAVNNTVNPAKNLEDTAIAAGLTTSGTLATIIGQIIYAILGFLGIIFILLLIYGGFLRMTAQGDPGKIKTSYGIITSAVIGVVIILASYTITAFIIGQVEGSVGNGGGGSGNASCSDYSGYSCMNAFQAGGSGGLYEMDCKGSLDCSGVGSECCKKVRDL